MRLFAPHCLPPSLGPKRTQKYTSEFCATKNLDASANLANTPNVGAARPEPGVFVFAVGVNEEEESKTV